VSRRPRAVAIVIAVAGLAGAVGTCAFASRGPHLLVEDIGGRRILHRERAWPGAIFTLDYIHSSERVPVQGTFRIERDGALAVVETAFAGFGPGLPQLGPRDDWRIERGMIVHRPQSEPLAELRVRVARVARQRLTTPSGRALDLWALTAPGAAILVKVR
jgi:hypothetical protein